jgi:hypothetical protein
MRAPGKFGGKEMSVSRTVDPSIEIQANTTQEEKGKMLRIMHVECRIF